MVFIIFFRLYDTLLFMTRLILRVSAVAIRSDIALASVERGRSIDLCLLRNYLHLSAWTTRSHKRMPSYIRKSSMKVLRLLIIFFFFQAEDGIRDYKVTGVQTCALPI